MIDFPIIDTHLHLWNPKVLRYPWLDNIPGLNRPYLLADYKQACEPVRVEKMIFVQCECEPLQYQRDVEWVLSLAQDDPRIQGIVPWAPLEKGAAVRAELAGLAAHNMVKGIRRIIQFESDGNFCLRPDFIRGVRLLAQFDLHFEICVKGDEQFRNILELVRRCPRVRFILDHVGKPFIKEGLMEPWKTCLRELAAQPNTWCKISGLATEADCQKWTREQIKTYVDHALDCFGWDRVMFGGDWPVACQATEYPRWVATLQWAVRGASRTQIQKLFHNNAVGFYRL